MSRDIWGSIISLDKQKQPPYTSAIEKQCLINSINSIISWVIYGGGGESVASLAGKHIDCAISTVASANSLIRANRIRPLLVIGEERDISLPDIAIPEEQWREQP